MDSALAWLGRNDSDDSEYLGARGPEYRIEF
jgi:hypothetical protein